MRFGVYFCEKHVKQDRHKRTDTEIIDFFFSGYYFLIYSVRTESQE